MRVLTYLHSLLGSQLAAKANMSSAEERAARQAAQAKAQEQLAAENEAAAIAAVSLVLRLKVL
jgi:hypothetical protein